MLSSKQAVKNIATENFNTYSNDWLSDDDLQALADGFWENRTDLEIERDEKEDVTEDDYYNWVEEAFTSWFANNYEELGVNADEKEAYLEHIHRVGYDKSFEMFKDQWIK